MHITSLALAKVADKIAMEETGIEDERTLARYKRFSDSERREMLSKSDYIGSDYLPRERSTNRGHLLSFWRF